jgi:hypothetical protein
MRGETEQRCRTCGAVIADAPLCYGAEAPWRTLGVPDSEFDRRVDLTPDQCVVDEKVFMIRGHILLPIVGSSEIFAWSVWCSLSERSFLHMSERWFAADRANDPPYFGWLMTELPCYPSTLHLKTSVQSRDVGVVPAVIVQPSDHPLAIEQENGISMERVREIAHEVLHERHGA